MSNLLVDKLVLPGMLDRAAMLPVLEAAAQVARIDGRPLAVLTLDIDDLMQFRKEHGPARAEAVVHTLAECLSRQQPEFSQLAHLGGDEFLLMLPSTDLAAAAALAETLRIEAKRVLAAEGGDRPLTITIGVAASPAGKDWTASHLLSLADARMTFAKKRLLPHHDLVWAGTLPSDWYLRLDVQAGAWPSL